MKTKILCILIGLFLNTNLFAHDFDGKILATIKVQNPITAILTFKKHAIDIAAVSRSEKVVDVVINDSEFKKLKELGFEPEILLVKGVTRGPDERYKKPHDIERLLKDFNTEYPELTELVSIGKSLEGRDIWAMKITGSKKEDKPVVLFNGMHHAREVMTPEIVLDVTEYLLTKYSTDAEVKTWVDNLEVWVLPMLNVDGNQKVWDGSSMWRKNTRGGFGVDINRNYPVGWNSCNGSSSRTWAQDYRGESPASEPETQVMMSFVSSIRPVFNISYHAYSELVIFPYGCSPQNAKGMVEKIGHELGKILDYKAGTAWELLYNADGGDIDWMYHELGVLPYVIEVNDRWAGFQPNFELWRDETVEKNRPGWKLLLEKTLGSGLRGKYTGSKAKSLEVHQGGKLFSSYPLKESGSFHLVLDPGTYEVRTMDGTKKVISSKKFEVTKSLQTKVILRD